MPNIDEKHANEIQVVLVVSDAKPGETRKAHRASRTKSTRVPMHRSSRIRRRSAPTRVCPGKATTTLMQKSGSAMLSFSGETATGVKVEGEVNCRKVDAA